MRQASRCNLQQGQPLTRALRNAGLSLLIASPFTFAATTPDDSQTREKSLEEAVKLKTVKVTAEATDGGAEQGYRTETFPV